MFRYDSPILFPIPMTSAIAPRQFKLAEQWRVTVIGATEYPNGEICIPKHFVADGASIPFPWLMTFMSFGVLRPVGIMFEAAIVHDYAYEHQGLLYGDGFKVLTVTQADILFRDMVAIKSPTIARLAWWGMRLWRLFKRLEEYR